MKNLYKFLINQKEVITHGGTFHADDVFASAFIKKINKNIKIIRTLDTTRSGFYYDFGLGEYDHHQSDALWRDDKSTKYCGFGLLFKDAGLDYFQGNEAKFNYVDENLVKLIDIADNTPTTNIISLTVARFNPAWDEQATDKMRYAAFTRALNFATLVLDYYLDNKNNLKEICEIVSERTIAAKEAEARALKAITNSAEYISEDVIVLKQYIPFRDYCNDHREIKYVVFPHLRGGWAVQTPSHLDENGNAYNVCPLLEGAELEQFNCSFRHNTGFLAVFPSREDAVAAAQYNIEKSIN